MPELYLIKGTPFPQSQPHVQWRPDRGSGQQKTIGTQAVSKHGFNYLKEMGFLSELKILLELKLKQKKGSSFQQEGSLPSSGCPQRCFISGILDPQTYAQMSSHCLQN